MVLLALLLLAAIFAAPLTFLTMLFLGNVGHGLGFLELYPGIIALVALKSITLTGKS